jgi:hypothetical protein
VPVQADQDPAVLRWHAPDAVKVEGSEKMKIVLSGSTGFVASAILKEGLQRGHEVPAIVRHRERLT